MNDLISRSALLEKATNVKKYDEGGWDMDLRAVPVEDIENAPAVDAVEVVRCKDCKHSRERNEYEKAYLVDGVRVCTHPECSSDCWFATWDDHWCSYGERRADDAN
jgi:hypothetical protein